MIEDGQYMLTQSEALAFVEYGVSLETKEEAKLRLKEKESDV